VGPSRKSFLGDLLGLPSDERVLGTAVACALAYVRGARIFRVHDVTEAVQALRIAHTIEAERGDVLLRGGE
jgi:dihydropteroate synthase